MTDIDAKDNGAFIHNGSFAQNKRVKYVWRALLCVCAAAVMGSVLILALPSLRSGIIHLAEVHLVHRALNAPVWHGRFVKWARWAIAVFVLAPALIVAAWYALQIAHFVLTGAKAMRFSALLKGSKASRRIFVSLCLAVMSFIFVTSYTSIYRHGQRWTDSSVFTTVAMQMQAGMMPYRDTFDHKGPLIYIYNFIGNCISLEWGILIVEGVSAFAALLAFYKIARRCCTVIVAPLSAALSMIPVIVYFEGGNLTEEYAVPFIAWGLWVFIEYFQFGKVSKLRLALCGFCFGAVCLLRANMAAVWAVFCIAVLISSIREKRYAEIGHFLLWFMAGFALIVLPIVLWLAFNGALKDFVADYLLFNGRYITDGARASLLNKCKSFIHFAKGNCIVISFIVLVYLWQIKKEAFAALYLIYAIATLVFICLSGQAYGHYGMVLSPVFSYPLSRLLSRLEYRLEGTARRIICRINKETVVFALILVIAFCPWRVSIYKAQSYIRHCIHGIPQNEGSEDNFIARYIKEHTSKKDRIIVYGNRDGIYVLSRRLPASKYSYQFPIGQVYSAIMDEFFDEMEKCPPKVFMMDIRYSPNYKETQRRAMSFLSRHGYREEEEFACSEQSALYVLPDRASHD